MSLSHNTSFHEFPERVDVWTVRRPWGPIQVEVVDTVPFVPAKRADPLHVAKNPWRDAVDLATIEAEACEAARQKVGRVWPPSGECPQIHGIKADICSDANKVALLEIIKFGWANPVRARVMKAAKQRTQRGYCLGSHHDHSPKKGCHMMKKKIIG